MFYVDVKNPQAGSETKQHEEVRQHFGRRRRKLNEWKGDENRSGDHVINFENNQSSNCLPYYGLNSSFFQSIILQPY